nr:outer membrane beta-barrel protein [Pyrinomonadaceae bacterium]
ASTAFAQNSDDYNRVELYGGYSRASVQPNAEATTVFGSTVAQCSSAATDILGRNYQTSFCQRRGFNGFDASITYNFNRYFGIKGNVSGHSKTEPFTDFVFGNTETINTKQRIYNFLGGVQVKDNGRTARFKPFAHALFGAAVNTFRGVNTSAAIPEDNYTLRNRVTSFAMKLGGGIDLRLNRRVDLRLVELDYNPIFTRNFDISGFPFSPLSQTSRRANNFTIGFGIAFH